MLPLRVFDGWVKQIIPAELSDAERELIQIAFPQLTPPDRDEVNRNVEHLRKTSEANHILPVYKNKRRFAGDWTLSAGRYFTVCKDASGNDHATLIAELAAYHEHARGAMALADFPSEQDAADYGGPYRPRQICIQLQGTPGSNALLAKIRRRIEWIPYKVEHISLPEILDLRYPDAQKWLVTNFADWANYLSRNLGVDAGPLASRWNKPSSFLEMLPTLPAAPWKCLKSGGLKMRRFSCEL